MIKINITYNAIDVYIIIIIENLCRTFIFVYSNVDLCSLFHADYTYKR